MIGSDTKKIIAIEGKLLNLCENNQISVEESSETWEHLTAVPLPIVIVLKIAHSQHHVGSTPWSSLSSHWFTITHFCEITVKHSHHSMPLTIYVLILYLTSPMHHDFALKY
ncbi:unnamed protein product [Heterobilharzia americana]|nr:unnamed protein product [Heterobilharzia americana]